MPGKTKIRNSKSEILNNFKWSKIRKFQTSPSRILCLGFKSSGLFRSAGLLSIFGFQILFHWCLGTITFLVTMYHAPLRFFNSSMSWGMTLKTSPTTPKSEY